MLSEGVRLFFVCVLHSIQDLDWFVRMESMLRGMSLPTPRFRLAPISEKLSDVNGFHSLQTYFPTLSKLFRITKHQTNGIWLDSKYRIAGIDISGTSGLCMLDLVANLDASGQSSEKVNRCPAFLKVTHLLDPIRWMKGEYSLPKQSGLPWHTKTWAAAWTKLQDSSNQAYIEAVASYAFGRLREAGVSPHFNEFYGAFCARAGIYRYNLTEEFKSFRHSRWFWHGQKRGLYCLHVAHAKSSKGDVPEDTLKDILREPSDMGSEKEESEEELDVELVDDVQEIASLHSDKMSELSFAEEHSLSGSSDETELEEEYRIYSEIRDFPVIMIGLENNRGTMDSLLDDYTLVGAAPGEPEWELKWSAWLFQVLAALSVAQAIFGFTHNDLHTNNIVWTETAEEYMYYTKRSGEIFKVPTYGKLFRIIDFGRAIFTINDQQFFSDDFKAGNDAEGQYSFKPLHPKPVKEVNPNPSFDLSRLAVSLFDALFPDTPENKEDGLQLSSEDGLEVMETVSPLYNALWSWMIDDYGRNVLIEPSGEERFPDFDLYRHIAAHVHRAVPAQQFSQPAFDRFQVNASEVGDDVNASELGDYVKKWSLFI